MIIYQNVTKVIIQNKLNHIIITNKNNNITYSILILIYGLTILLYLLSHVQMSSV